MLRNVPTYPFPIKHTFKQSWFGLYGGKHIQFGNNVGPKSQFKTRRFWLPNIRHTHLYSNALGMNLNLEVATSVLRTIDKVGGLDNYLLGSKNARLKELGPKGWKLRHRILNSPWYQKMAAEEREALSAQVTQATAKADQAEALEEAADAAAEAAAIQGDTAAALEQVAALGEQNNAPQISRDEAGNVKL